MSITGGSQAFLKSLSAESNKAGTLVKECSLRPFRAFELWKEQCTRAHTGHTERCKTCRDTRSHLPGKVLVEMSKAKPVQAWAAECLQMCMMCLYVQHMCQKTSSYISILKCALTYKSSWISWYIFLKGALLNPPTDLVSWFRVRLSCRHLASPLEIKIWEEFEKDITLEKNILKQKSHFLTFWIFWFILNSPQIWHWHWGGDPAPCRAIRSHRHQNPSNAFKSEDIKDHLFLMQILLTQRTRFITCTQII